MSARKFHSHTYSECVGKAEVKAERVKREYVVHVISHNNFISIFLCRLQEDDAPARNFCFAFYVPIYIHIITPLRAVICSALHPLPCPMLKLVCTTEFWARFSIGQMSL